MMIARPRLRNICKVTVAASLTSFIGITTMFSISNTEELQMDCKSPHGEKIGAYRLCGVSEIKLMQPMDKPRSDFVFLRTPWNVTCSQSKGEQAPRWAMIIGIKSHFMNFDGRKWIRESWGSYSSYKGVKMELFFVVGKTNNPTVSYEIDAEAKKYGDLLMIDLEEKYTDVGLKALAALQWVSERCPEDWIYSSADDDMGPNFPKLYAIIESLMSQNAGNIQRVPIVCGYSYRPNEAPLRNPESRNSVPYNDYPKGIIYPPFCAGGFYSMPVKLSNAIYRVSRQHQYFYNDDVWITGLLRLAVIDKGDFPCDDITDKYCAISKVDYSIVKHLSNTTHKIMYYVGRIWERLLSLM